MNRPFVAFDLDDTLYLERDYVRSGFEAAGEWAKERVGIADFSQRAWRWFEQGRRGDIFNQVLAEIGRNHDDSLVDELVQAYRTHKPRIALLADAGACLRLLRGKAPLAIVTDGPVSSQRAKIEALGLERLIDEFVFTHAWGPEFAKPHPRAFQFLQTRWASTCSRFVYVGDNPVKDFPAPRALGWMTVRVRRPDGLYYSVRGPDGTAAHLEVNDLLEFLDALWPRWHRFQPE
ncbi:MAG: HAD family hydrolase [Planctomycetes bacterium]|nr:HAD family hydrolase [Planctomycetota bacterium]